MNAITSSARTTSLGRYIFISLIAGIIVGQLAHFELTNPAIIKTTADNLDIISSIFLRLIKTIAAPLIFTTLIAGIAKMEDSRSLGRIFLKSMIIFILGGLAVLVLGVVLAEFFQPGKTLHDAILNSSNHILAADSSKICTNCQINFKDFINQIVPNSALQGFVENHMLQVIILAVLIGIAGHSLGDKFTDVFAFFELMSQLLFKIIGYIMWLAPIAVFSSIAKIVMASGIQVLQVYLVFISEFYLGLGIIWLGWIIIAYLLVHKLIFTIIKTNFQLYLTAFAASSSESIMPAMLANFPKFGISQKISGLVVPLGYAFNLEASMFNCTFATLFIIQVYGYHMDWLTELTMLLMLMLTTKGIAGIPRASLIVVAATLVAFGYPEAGILLILPIDGINDMGRSATSAFAQTMSAVVVDHWEKKHKPVTLKL